MAVGAQFHVLAVDDSSIDRKLIERLLKTCSFKVTAVDSVTKALEYLRLQEEKIDSESDTKVNLIVTDYCMPGMTGYDLLKKIKESDYLKDKLVVVMSSENIPSRISKCLEDGAEEFILKPVRLSDMDRIKPHLLIRTTRSCQLAQMSHSRSLKQSVLSMIPAFNNAIETSFDQDGFDPYHPQTHWIKH